MTSILYTEKHPYANKQRYFSRKIDPIRKFTILQLYLQLKNTPQFSSFKNVKQLASYMKITREKPSKIKKEFESLWNSLLPNKSIDYSFNIFKYKESLVFHHKVSLKLHDKSIKLLSKFIKSYPRWGFHTYQARLLQKNISSEFILPESTFKYYKPILLKHLKLPRKKRNYKNKKEASLAKSFFNHFYKTFDFIINLDGKDLSDIPSVQKNPFISTAFKRISQAVEIKSGAIFKLATEKSHNKSNAHMIIKEIVETLESIFWSNIKILFLTDAGSEYLNNKKLRWIEITSLDTSEIAKYLFKHWHEMRITRFKQDNWFIENKNLYIEKAFLDDNAITKMTPVDFIDWLQSFMDMNNSYLKWSNKFVYRGKDNTPKDNLISRFWKEKIKQLFSSLLVNHMEWMYNLPTNSYNNVLFHILNHLKPHLSVKYKKHIHFKKVCQKRLDSSIFIANNIKVYENRKSYIEKIILFEKEFEKLKSNFFNKNV